MITSAPWPLTNPGLETVRSFIEKALPEAKNLQGPISIFASYDDGPDRRATALFETGDPKHRQVVVKANLFSFLSGSKISHELVARYAPGLVPELLSSVEFEDGSLLLQSAFEGQPVDEVKNAEAILQVGQVLARIQQQVSEKAQIPQEPTDFKKFFKECISNIENYFAACWARDDEALGKALGFRSSEVLARLKPILPEIENWSEILSNANVPNSIHHGDCHAGNAALRPDGTVLIFDWENACFAHPFLSAEKLMTSAWGLDVGVGGGPWGYVRDTPTQDALVTAYLGEFSEAPEALIPAFNAAMCLAVIKEIHHEMEWARLCNWVNLNPEWSAQLINRLFQHRARLDASR